MREVADDVTGVIVPGTAHWVPEEQPEAFVDAVLRFSAPGSSPAARGSPASREAS